MTWTSDRLSRYAGWLCEFLFALNFAWAFEWLDRQMGSPGLFPRLESSSFLQILHRFAHVEEPSAVVEQVAWSFVLALLMFPVVRLFGWLMHTKILPRILAGMLALAALPLVYLCFSWTFLSGGSGIRGWWPIVELVAMLCCGVLYYLRTWPPPTILIVTLLALHFSLWSLVTGTYVNVRFEIQHYGLTNPAFYVSMMFYFGFPVLGFLSGLAWTGYVRLDDTERARAQA